MEKHKKKIPIGIDRFNIMLTKRDSYERFSIHGAR